jgi:hypothetical protein
MNDRLGELSEAEIQVILRHRAARARSNRPMTRFEKISLYIIRAALILAILVATRMLFQVKQLIDEGENYQPSAPLSWMLVPKQPVESGTPATAAPAGDSESGSQQ